MKSKSNEKIRSFKGIPDYEIRLKAVTGVLVSVKDLKNIGRTKNKTPDGYMMYEIADTTTRYLGYCPICYVAFFKLDGEQYPDSVSCVNNHKSFFYNLLAKEKDND